MKHVYAAGILLFREVPARQFLLMKHPTRWDLPKGRADAGESLQACALREFEEETGIPADDIRLNPRFEFRTTYTVKYPDSPMHEKTLVIFLAWLQADDPTIHLTEHSGYQWFDWQPPHRFDNPTIDPLLAQTAAFFQQDDTA